MICDSAKNSLYLAGSIRNEVTLYSDICLLKYDSSGILQWNRTWGGNTTEVCYALVTDSLDNIHLTGLITGFEGGIDDVCVLEYDSSGVLTGNNTWGGSNNDRGFKIAIDSSDNIYISGTTNSFGAGGDDICLLKYDNTGILQWNITVGGESDDRCYGVLTDSSDNIHLVGHIQGIGTQLFEYNSSGVLQKTLTWDGDYLDWCYAVALDSTEDIYLAGEGGGDMVLIKIPRVAAISIPGYELVAIIGIVFAVSVFLFRKYYKSLKSII